MKIILVGKNRDLTLRQYVFEQLGMDCRIMEDADSGICSFLRNEDCNAIILSGSFQQSLLPYLDKLTESAASYSRVSLVTCQDGLLIGYYTVADSVCRYLDEKNVIPIDGKCAVYHTSSDPSLFSEVLQKLNSESAISNDFSSVYESQMDYTLLINDSDVGGMDDLYSVPFDLEKFTRVRGIIEMNALPMRTGLTMMAEMLNIPVYGSVELLVNECCDMAEMILNITIGTDKREDCLNGLLWKYRNIVLIGMPAAGKSTLGAMLADDFDKKLIETDLLIEEDIKTTIPDYFSTYGEEAFRKEESHIVRMLTEPQGAIISSGGGIIKNPDNIFHLACNGFLIWIDRAVELLKIDDSRPLVKKYGDLLKIFEDRKDLYRKYGDIRIENNDSLQDALDRILTGLRKDSRHE